MHAISKVNNVAIYLKTSIEIINTLYLNLSQKNFSHSATYNSHAQAVLTKAALYTSVRGISPYMICFSKPVAFSISISLIPMSKKAQNAFLKILANARKPLSKSAEEQSFLLCCGGQFNGLAQLREETAQQKALEKERDLSAKFAHSHISLLTDQRQTPQCHMSWRRAKEIA